MSGILHENFINVHKGDIKSILPNAVKRLLNNPKSKSSLGIKYPSLRDHPLKIGSVWLAGKRLDDGAEGLWRIHDRLYDLSSFVDSHPGGRGWLQMTKGTDITEAFECHHLTELPTKMLTDFYIREAKTSRNSPFTFKEDGFYRTLKKDISEALQTAPKQPIQRSKYMTDSLLFAYIVLALLAVYLGSYIVGALSGVMLCLVVIAAHNFFHQKDNFRMYYFDLSMMQSKEWRISHALSHHLFPNTILDIEVSSLEPFLQYLPNENLLIFRYFSWLYSPIFYAFMFFGHFVKAISQKFAFGESLELVQFLPFTVLAAMYIITGETLLNCSLMFAWIITIGSVLFGLIGVNAGHHHPDSFHDGDAIRPQDQMDWGFLQLDAVLDRKDIYSSHFLVLTQFGNHALHHLFPTIDHGQLEYLYPVFLKTCRKFGVDCRTCTTSESYKGQFQQLLRTEPNKIVPGTPEYYK